MEDESGGLCELCGFTRIPWRAGLKPLLVVILMEIPLCALRVSTWKRFALSMAASPELHE